MKKSIPTPVAAVLDLLWQNKHEAYLVGGCVRDFVMGLSPSDYDITTNATPQQVKQLCTEHSYHVIETGMQHGTLTVVSQNIPIEITTYRIDGAYTDNRHPKKVTFTADLKQDLMRRDFTMNALAYHPKGEIIDYFGGLHDIDAKLICCVGDPTQRFQEDALRILRAIRFSSTLGFVIESNTMCAIHRQKARIGSISNERIANELARTIIGDYLNQSLPSVIDVIYYILPEITDLPCFTDDTFSIQHIFYTVQQLPKRVELRFAALFLEFGITANIAHQILRRLRFSNAITHAVTSIMELAYKPVTLDRCAIKQQLATTDSAILISFFQYRQVAGDYHAAAYLALIEDIVAHNEPYCISHLALSGNDLIDTNICQGKAIGDVLKYLQSQVIKDPKCNERQILLQLAKAYLKTK